MDCRHGNKRTAIHSVGFNPLAINSKQCREEGHLKQESNEDYDAGNNCKSLHRRNIRKCTKKEGHCLAQCG